MSTIEPIEQQSRAYGVGSNPMELRHRMVERGIIGELQNDFEILSALRQMDEETRWQAWQLLTDAECARVIQLVHLEEDED